MEKSRLKPSIVAMLLEKKNEQKVIKISVHFDIGLASLKQAIRRNSEYLTQPAYEVQIQKALGLPSNAKISEIYTIDQQFLSNHN
jgi:hypothetical protein